MKKFIPNPGGQFFNPKLRLIFIPDSAPVSNNEMSNQILSNPVFWQEWGLPTSARLFIGFRTGRRTPYFPRLRSKISEKLVRNQIRGIRVMQSGVGWQYGGTFISQTGHWQDEKTGEIFEEPSLQVVIFPGEKETWRLFKKNISALVKTLLTELAQENIIVEFQRKGKISSIGRFVWRKRRK